MLFLLNPGAMTIHAMISLLFFYDQSTYQYEWISMPFFMVVSNLIFWMPVAIMINRYVVRHNAKGFTKSTKQ